MTVAVAPNLRRSSSVHRLALTAALAVVALFTTLVSPPSAHALTREQIQNRTTNFVSNWNGSVIGSGQCVALIHQFNSGVLGWNSAAGGTPGDHGAHEWYDMYPSWNALNDRYRRIARGAEAPIKGDVIVWNTNVGGGFGHIAVVLDRYADGDVLVFQQNWNTNYASKLRMSQSNVLGYLRPRAG